MAEVAVTYAALILQDDGIQITSDKIRKLLEVANVQVEGYWVDLFVDYFKRNDIGTLLKGTSLSSAAPAATVSASSGGEAAAPVEEAKAEKKEEEEVVELASGFDDLFG
jgi:large subunit ribosomal protein LP1